MGCSGRGCPTCDCRNVGGVDDNGDDTGGVKLFNGLRLSFKLLPGIVTGADPTNKPVVNRFLHIYPNRKYERHKNDNKVYQPDSANPTLIELFM